MPYDKELEDLKECIKLIESETMEIANVVKLDLHRRNGLESKFVTAYDIIEKMTPKLPKLEPAPKKEVKPVKTFDKPKKTTAKVDIKTGIKKII